MHYHSVGCENHLQFEDAQEALRVYDDNDDYKIVIMINDDNEDDFETIMLLMIIICITMKLNMLCLTLQR